MTFSEADERAQRFWPDAASVQRLRHAPERWEVLVYVRASGRYRPIVHVMDDSGHPICHPECIALEDALGAPAG